MLRNREDWEIMVSVEEHYKKLLAHYYTWTRGGFDSGAREYKRVIEELGSSSGRGAQALDLGAGSGF
jgi:hypothetical protein